MSAESAQTTNDASPAEKHKPRRLEWSVEIGTPDADTFYLVVHGLDSSPHTIEGVCRAIGEQPGSAHILVPKMPFEWWRTGDPKELGHEILDYLQEEQNLSRYRAIRLVGHSAGGVIVQAVYLIAKSERTDHPLARLQGEQLRLILIAPINRGWEITHHLPLAEKIAWSMGSLVMPLLYAWFRLLDTVRGRTPAPLWIGELRRGSPFLIWMRLTWLKLKQNDHWSEQAIEVFQLLGSVDEIVSWRDMVDTEVGDDFLYFEVPYSDHIGIVDYDDPVHGTQRRAVLDAALAPREIAAVSPFSVIPWDTDPAPPEPDVARVVFVIHGIRDEGHWTQKIASRARRSYEAARVESRRQIAVVTSSYGFFSLLQFLLLGARRAKVQWLLDLYTEAKRRYPKAELSYIGHSNGTFLLAHALHRHPEVRFQRVAFAGSVVSSRYDWQTLRQRGQVDQVLNFVADKDFVVGLLPRISDILPGKLPFGPDIGGAGVQPFAETDGVTNRKFRVGGHGAAIVEDNWETLARFAVEASTDPKQIEEQAPYYAQAPHWSLRGWWAPPIALSTCALLLLVFAFLEPTLAWFHPQYFFASFLLPLVIGLPWAARIRGKASGVPFGDREALKRRAERIIGITFGTIAVALLAGSVLNWIGNPLLQWLGIGLPSTGILCRLGITCQEATAEWLRTVAVGTYLLLAYFVLTRV